MSRASFSLASLAYRVSKFCHFSTIKTIQVTPDSYIKLACSVPDLSINITSQWRDSVEWDISDNLQVSHEYEHGDLIIYISAIGSITNATNGKINIRTPEMINLDISSTHAFGLVTKNKVSHSIYLFFTFIPYLSTNYR